MIICHPRKLIFVKTKKVGGTSFEIALSGQCGPDCVITKIPQDDEKMRAALGFRGAQNWHEPRFPKGMPKEALGFANHASSSKIRRGVPREVWDDYQKVTIVRSPFDVVISQFFWHFRNSDATLAQFPGFVRDFRGKIAINETIAPFDGPEKLDVYLRYEALGAEMEANGLGDIFATMRDIRAKGAARPKRGTTAAEVYAQYPEAADIVEEKFAKTIARFGYERPQ